MDKTSGNTTTGKRGARKEARRDTSTTPLNSDGKTMTNIVPPKLFIAGRGESSRYLDHLTTIHRGNLETAIPTRKQPSMGVNDGSQPGST